MEQIKVVTLDLETEGLNPWKDKITLLGYRYNSSGPVTVIKICDGEKPDAPLIHALHDSSIVKRGANVHFDLLCLVSGGFSVGPNIDDTRILAYLENPYQELDLKTLTEKKLKRKAVRIEDFGKKFSEKQLEKRFKKHPLLMSRLIKAGKYWVSKQTLIEYNKADVINCDDLKKDLISTKWYKDVEQPLASVLFNAEKTGMQLDIPYFKGLQIEYEKKIEEIKKSFPEGFNPASPKQIIEYYSSSGIKLDDSRGHTLKLRSWEGDRFAKQVLLYRRYSKLLGTYIKPFLEISDKNGRLHGYFNQAGRETELYGDVNGPATGRLSSSDPNLQNIPTRTEEGKKIRKGFIAQTGQVLIVSDLSQIEPRILAHYSQATKLIHAYKNNLDTHKIMAADIFGKPVDQITKNERFIGKTGWLQISYRSGYKKLRFMVENNSDEPLPKEYNNDLFYENIIKNWWDKNSEIKEWEDQHITETRTRGFIQTIGGRQIRIPNLNSHNKMERWAAERQAINYQIQGSAADIIKIILVKLAKELQNKGTIVATIHDEIIVECKKEVAQEVMYIVHNAMTKTISLNNVSIEAETKVCNNWSEK